MWDFLISSIVTLVTNIYIIFPYLDQLKDFWILRGQAIEQVNNTYHILCALSYLVVAGLVYGSIRLIKLLIRHFDK